MGYINSFENTQSSLHVIEFNDGVNEKSYSTHDLSKHWHAYKQLYLISHTQGKAISTLLDLEDHRISALIPC